ncbi:NADPH-dependent FMN reductase [Pseudonocardia sp. MH-G8]|uniref:NADPH-dependent FMN reductase n=1 Tax=Pseudonocardia sp. MH-G8 TaxID=1854588 RepID=UPI000BA0D97A|nr:NAD(P)H-dependent oxidoreductase [Pseudonocardia sp. MH-G8]OZM83599.1 NADPH-dependent FMN reductase [Pseudonocardia sp. MH-G8]
MSVDLDHTTPRPAAPGGPLRVALVIGSVREGRVGCAIARWAATHAERRADLEIDLVDLRDVDLPADLPDDPTIGLSAWAKRVEAADAFVVVTPEYNRGIPAALKHAIDAVREEWYAKPVAVVAYGGQARGLRAAEQLRLVFGELHVQVLRDTVCLGLGDGALDESGWVCDPGAVRALEFALDRLTWWGTALRTARTDQPYVR